MYSYIRQEQEYLLDLKLIIDVNELNQVVRNKI